MKLEKERLAEMYRKMVKIRYFEEQASAVWAQGLIPGLIHLYIGEEAVAVGACMNTSQEDYITSTHRGHGHCIAKGGDLKRMMAELLAKKTGYSKGKGGSMHICVPEIGVMGCSGIVGAGIPIATGLGLAAELKDTDQVVICFFGDGSTNTGTFHEGINLAALWKLPVIFVCENNLYAISVPTSKSSSVKDLADKAKAYGMPNTVVDGMDVVAVYGAVQDAVKRARDRKGPTFIECKTYRFRGHFEGDPKQGGTYRTEVEMAEWEKKCPIKNFRSKLMAENILTQPELEKIDQECRKEVEEALQFAVNSPDPVPADVLEDVFISPVTITGKTQPAKTGERALDVAEAIREALRQEMLRDETISIFGEDVGTFGGVFGCTKGLQTEFGAKRVRDTPISEAAIIGAAIGAALGGTRPVAEIQFMDFIGCGGAMDQITNQLAKIRYMFGGSMKVPVVIRTACGSRYPVASGAAQHSQCLEAWFMHVPGLKVVVPSTPFNAKGLLVSAIRDDDPVLYIEHKLLYYARRMPTLRNNFPAMISHVPEEAYTIPFGQADIKREGQDVTVIATMMMVHRALNAAKELAKEGVEIEVIDPQTLIPFDKQTIIDSVKKTGRVVVASEDCKTAGVAAEITAIIQEEAFDYLDAPVKRVSALDVPIPYSRVLEGITVPQEKHIIDAIKTLVKI